MEIKNTLNVTQFACETNAFLIGLLVGAGIHESKARDIAREGQSGIEQLRENNSTEIEEE